jgi:2-methylcitrate dehydratase PrpD
VSDGAYRVAFLDWLACAVGGRDEPAARAAAALGDGVAERVAAAGTAGHVLDFDDTHAPSLAHLSAAPAPAALVVGADEGASTGDVLRAYAAGFEATGRLAVANHPELRARGWHPTAVCGVVGAAVGAARLLGLDSERSEHAVRLALLRAGGLHAAFGSDGKALQVGLAAAAGAGAARLAAAGATAGPEVYGGFEEAFGARWPDGVLDPEAAAGRMVDENWIKAYPCCLQTHSAIEVAARVRADGAAPDGPIEVVVHPVALQTAWRTDVATGLEAKFSIPYLTAFTLLHGEPRVESFAGVDPEARALAADRITVRTDPTLGESEACLAAGGRELARVDAALGSPARPMDEAALAAKVRYLAGDRLDGAPDDPDRPARELLERLGSWS